MCEDFAVRYEDCATVTPAVARRFVTDSLRSELAGPQAGAVMDTTVLIMSELATNALRAGCGWLALDLEVRREHLRVAVSDDAPGWPVPRPAAPHDVRGRGLAIVDSVSREWGAQPAAAGKQVWAKVAVPEGLAHSHPCL